MRVEEEDFQTMLALGHNLPRLLSIIDCKIRRGGSKFEWHNLSMLELTEQS